MKWQWTTDELIDEWTLLPEEESLLANKTGATRLGFAILFKYFQHEGCFPQQKQDVPGAVITYLARLLTLPPELFLQYDWGGRQIKRHRMQIRAALGYHAATITDARALRDWLCDQVLPQDQRHERLIDLVYAECRERRIEPPTPERISRLVRSAQRRFEDRLFTNVMQQLPLATRAALEALLLGAGDLADLPDLTDEPESAELVAPPVAPGDGSPLEQSATTVHDEEDGKVDGAQVSAGGAEHDRADLSAWNIAGILASLDDPEADLIGEHRGESERSARERPPHQPDAHLTIQASVTGSARSASAFDEQGEDKNEDRNEELSAVRRAPSHPQTPGQTTEHIQGLTHSGPLPSGKRVTVGVENLSLQDLRTDPGPTGLDSVLREIDKLLHLRRLDLPAGLFAPLSPRVLQLYRNRAAMEAPSTLRAHPQAIRLTLLAALCWCRQQEVTDELVALLIALVHRMGARAERRVERQYIDDLKRVAGKTALLYKVAEVAVARPDDTVRDAIYPVVSEKTLRDLVKEYKASGPLYREHVYVAMKTSFRSYYRRMLPKLLEALTFRSNNELHRPVIQALDLIRSHLYSGLHFYPAEETVPLDGVIRPMWRELVVEQDLDGSLRVHRLQYELGALQALRDGLRSKEIWVEGARRFGNPEEDLPADFEAARETYYAALKQPLAAERFIERVRMELTAALERLDATMPRNKGVKLLTKKGGWIQVSPFAPLPEPPNLARLKVELVNRWPMTGLLDILKETALRTQFTDAFTSIATREALAPEKLQKRLLLGLYALGTNTGLKRLAGADAETTYADLRYVRRRYVTKEQLRGAIAEIANAIFRVRQAPIWGEGTSACASDSKKFGAWDQNLMTEWSIRHFGRGVMVYWHVDTKSVCIYSQLKTISSSEVAAMIEGVLRHCTDMEIQRQYVDSHGQSEVAFAFCHLLGFQLLPRLKGIHAQRLYRAHSGQPNAFPHLAPVLTRAIDWDLIARQYDQMIKYATALRLGTAETEAILRRFARANRQHPTYQALCELGKAIKTIFLCQYLHSEALRREIHDALNVIENWNSANSFIFYGKSGEIATNRLDEQEVSILCLHLLQISLVYVNTLMIQEVLGERGWRQRLTPTDLRALTPLIYLHVNPYGRFSLDMNERLPGLPQRAIAT